MRQVREGLLRYGNSHYGYSDIGKFFDRLQKNAQIQFKNEKGRMAKLANIVSLRNMMTSRGNYDADD